MPRQEFVNDARSRTDIVTRLKASATDRQRKGKAGDVLLCFVCDPYQPLESMHGITRAAIQILHDTGHTVTILTKAGQLPRRDFDLLGGGDSFAVTLTCWTPQDQAYWEANAGSTPERIDLLKEAHDRGIYTWASFEPVIYPYQTLLLIETVWPWIREAKIGKLNYHPYAKQVDWAKFVEDVTRLLDKLGIPYLIKKDTLDAARRKDDHHREDTH